MPFAASIDIIKKIIVFIDSKVKENEAYNKSIKQENEVFFRNLNIVNKSLGLMIDKLKAFQELSPTTEEVDDLKLRCTNLFNTVSNANDLLITIHSKYQELLDNRNAFKQRWYVFSDCFGKADFLEDLRNLNEELNAKMGLVNIEYDNLIILMNVYEKQIENLKFKFLPLRRLWISNKWDADANLSSQRVTIATLIQEIQSRALSRELHAVHYENMQTFLTKMIEYNKTQRQIEAIGLGKSCGTYFLNSSLISSLTNLPSEELKWNDLSDMVYYFSLLPIEKYTDDKITPEIIERYNENTNIKVDTYKEQLKDLKSSNNNEAKLLDKIVDTNIQKNLNNIIKTDKNRNYKAYIYKDGIKYIIAYKYASNHTTVFYETEKEGKLGRIDLDIHNVETYPSYHGYHCTFIKREYEKNSYFYVPPIIWHKGCGHEYSLHYDNNNDSWYLSRFDYSNDTNNNCSGIFVHKEMDSYNLLKRRGGSEIIKCDFTVLFE